MIFAEPTRYGAGIAIYGDYYDFKSLYETVHYLAHNVPLAGKFEEYVLGLAYEIRHAYQGDREIKQLGTYEFSTDVEKATYIGFKALWPQIMTQAGLLRWAAGFQCLTRNHQADLFSLEACVESSLKEYDLNIGTACFDWYTRFSGFSNNYLLEFIDVCSFEYVSTEKDKMRFRSLPNILRKIYQMSPEYVVFESELNRIANEKGCKADDLSDSREWPDFKW